MSAGYAWAISVVWVVAIWTLGAAIANTEILIGERRARRRSGGTR